MSKNKIGWNPTYFGEPKKGSLASVIADITNRQNEQQGGKPEVMDSAAVQAQKAKEQLAKEGKMMKATHKPGHKDDENTAKDMRKKNKDDSKGETSPIKVHGEDLNKEIENAKMGKVKSLVDTIKDMFYTPEAVQKELTDKQKKLPPALQKAIKTKEKKEKNEGLDKDDEKTVKDVIKGLKKASDTHAGQAKQLKKDISDAAKPDFLDLDKDGNKTEPMKKAAKDKAKKK